MSSNKFIIMTLEIDGQEVGEYKVRLNKSHIENHRNSLYYRYALKNKQYKIFIKIPAKKEESDRKYLNLNLNNLNFKPSEHDTSTEQ